MRRGKCCQLYLFNPTEDHYSDVTELRTKFSMTLLKAKEDQKEYLVPSGTVAQNVDGTANFYVEHEPYTLYQQRIWLLNYLYFSVRLG